MDTLFPFSIFRTPLSGDVIQNISPEIGTTEIAGHPQIERRVVREVASYGRQLGVILDVLEVLTAEADADDPRIARLRSMTAEVKELKAKEKESLKTRAQEALASLRKADPEGYQSLLGGLRNTE